MLLVTQALCVVLVSNMIDDSLPLFTIESNALLESLMVLLRPFSDWSTSQDGAHYLLIYRCDRIVFDTLDVFDSVPSDLIFVSRPDNVRNFLGIIAIFTKTFQEL